jgi:ectoine hydroxylase-related dioxygenase (phytanoyl-CoA dioxygenase family)
VNVGLVDMRPENGSTQLWLGSHNNDISAQEGAHGDRASGRIKADLLAARAKTCPPIQPSVKKGELDDEGADAGSIIVRDLRLWHAGMPNRTDEVRVMLAMIHFAPWYRQRMTMRLPRALRPVLDGNPRLAVSAQWVDEAVDHLDQPFGNAFDFSQDL